MNKIRFFLVFCIFPLLITCASSERTSIDVDIEPLSNGSSLDLESLPRDFEWLTYQVQRGDTLASVADQFQVSIELITAINKLQQLRELDWIKIPNINGIVYVIKPGDTISGVSLSHRVPVEIIVEANDLESEVLDEGDIIFLPGAAEEYLPQSRPSFTFEYF